jgi:hypothetical protein
MQTSCAVHAGCIGQRQIRLNAGGRLTSETHYDTNLFGALGGLGMVRGRRSVL